MEYKGYKITISTSESSPNSDCHATYLIHRLGHESMPAYAGLIVGNRLASAATQHEAVTTARHWIDEQQEA